MKTEELNIGYNDGIYTNALFFSYIEWWCNNKRIHSALTGLTPREASFEKPLKFAA